MEEKNSTGCTQIDPKKKFWVDLRTSERMARGAGARVVRSEAAKKGKGAERRAEGNEVAEVAGRVGWSRRVRLNAEEARGIYGEDSQRGMQSNGRSLRERLSSRKVSGGLLGVCPSGH